MTNADKFKSLFGLYATELWAMPEKDFLEWLNSEVMNCSESPNGWIPCTPETMPEEYQDVLVTLSDSDGSFVKEMQYIKGLFETDSDLYGTVDEEEGIAYADSFKAIAWMPLPAPFRTKEDKE